MKDERSFRNVHTRSPEGIKCVPLSDMPRVGRTVKVNPLSGMGRKLEPELLCNPGLDGRLSYHIVPTSRAKMHMWGNC